MGHLLLLHDRRADRFRRRNQPVDNNGSGLRAAVEAGPAAGAVLTGVLRRMHAVLAQLRRQEQALGRARLDTQAAPLTLFRIDDYVTTRLRYHSYPHTSAAQALR